MTAKLSQFRSRNFKFFYADFLLVIISLPSSMLSTSVNWNNKKLEMEVNMNDILFLERINT